jgi:hypothetical protein
MSCIHVYAGSGAAVRAAYLVECKNSTEIFIFQQPIAQGEPSLEEFRKQVLDSDAFEGEPALTR